MKITRPLTVSLLVAVVFLSACTAGPSNTSWPGLTADQNSAYVANASYVYSIRLSDGTLQWKFPQNAGKGFYATPALTSDGQLIVGGYDNILYSLNSKTGAQNWTFTQATDRWIGGVNASDQTIDAPSSDHILYALDLKGKLIWKYTTGFSLWATPVRDANRVYQPSMDHYLYALNASGGSLVWKTDLGGPAVGEPALSSSGVLYVGTVSKEMLAVDAASGKVLWRMPTTGGVWDKPIFDNGTLYFGDMSGNFYAVDAATGKVKWQINPGGAIIDSPLLTTSAIIFGTESGALVSTDFSGKILWNRQINGKLYTTPVQAGDRILVAISQGTDLVVAMDKNGNQVWSFIPPK
ncbi:MAG: PQQ-binding-like beta-propeller repeat protein [Chloroflexi bacterium]|nr:PQQ-binding-like beta-propeller repeat protein [Chloroflexota bacterium]